MNIITWTKGGTAGSKNVPSDELARTLFASFQKFPGYTDVKLNAHLELAPAAAPAAEVVTTTGRVGQGQHIHKLIAGHSACGASFRRGFGASRPTFATGQAVTCGSRACRD